MVDVAVLKLDEKRNWNRWVIGTMPAIDKSSPFYSEQIQVSYIRCPDIMELLKKERMHSHDSPIEEFYLVLAGQLELDVEGHTMFLKSREILSVPSDKNHRIIAVSDDLELLVFRAPISTDNLKKTKN